MVEEVQHRPGGGHEDQVLALNLRHVRDAGMSMLDADPADLAMRTFLDTSGKTPE